MGSFVTQTVSPHRTALAGFLILAIAMGIGRFAFTPILPMMQADGLIGVAGGGVLASVHFVGYAMGALVAGRLTAAPSATLFASLLAIGLSTVAMGLTDHYWIWLFVRWVAGFCSALVLVVVSTHFVTRLAAAGRPDLQGRVFAGVGAGIAIAGLGTLWLMTLAASSRLGWLTFGWGSLVAILLVIVLIGARPFEAVAQGNGQGRPRARLPWRLIVPYAAMGAGYIVPATYLPIMAQNVVSSPLVFGWGWPLFGLAAALSTLVSAKLHARHSNRQIWIAGQIVMAFGVLLPALSGHIAAVVVGGICVGGTVIVNTMAGLKEAHRVAGDGNAQHYVAAMTFAFAFGQVVGPVLAGWAYEVNDSFSTPLVLASALLIITLLPLIRIPSAAPCEDA